jgi:hypothetical protein
MYDRCYIISQNVSLLQKILRQCCLLYIATPRDPSYGFLSVKKIKKHVQIGVPIGSEKRNSQPPRHSPPSARDVWRGSPPRENAEICGLDSFRSFLTPNHPFFSRCRHTQEPPAAVLPPSPGKGSRQGADTSEPLLCSLPPASDAIVTGDVEAPPIVARHRQQVRHQS